MQKRTSVLIVLSLSILVSQLTFSQVKKLEKSVPTFNVKQDNDSRLKKWSLKAGGNISVIYLARNTKDKNNEPGFCGGVTYEVNDFIRVSSLYTRFRPINIKPTWLDVKANTYEANMEIVAKFPNKQTLLYPFVGLSYNTFSGYFTGILDYLNLKEYYAVNSTITNNWLGLNFGTGFEHNFGILGFFIDYRMRVGKQEKAFNIMDVCYTGGLKIRYQKIRNIKYKAQDARSLD